MRPVSTKRIEASLSAAQTNKLSSNVSGNRFNQRSLQTHQGSLKNRLPSQGLVISNQTLSQPLNPNAFLPGALKCFSKSQPQIVNMQNQRKYPQLSNDFLKRQATMFMAVPSPEILAEMREDGFTKDFQVENCRSSSEYLYCLLGFGLYQALSFPIMGIFYLELVRLIMQHMDRFSSNEKVKLIQVSNIAEDILRQNSTREDFLPIEVMDKIVEEAVKEESKIQKMIEDFHGEQVLDENVSNPNHANAKTDMSCLPSQVANDINHKLNMFSNISVSLSSESTSKKETTPERPAKRKRYTETNDLTNIIDIDSTENPIANESSYQECKKDTESNVLTNIIDIDSIENPIAKESSCQEHKRDTKNIDLTNIVDIDSNKDSIAKESSCQERNYKTTDRKHLRMCVECDFFEPIGQNIYPKNLSGITISTVSVSNIENSQLDLQPNVKISKLSSSNPGNPSEEYITPFSIDKEKSTCHLCQGPFIKRKKCSWKICKCRKRVHVSCFKKFDPSTAICTSTNFVFAEGSWTEL